MKPRFYAIIGATASGKSELALRLARQFGLRIFSIDSLSVYRGVNIASAKPSAESLREIPHYGIDALSPDEPCNAKVFFDLLVAHINEPLIIVGGSGFYLKAIIEGLSHTPKVSESVKKFVSEMLGNPNQAHALLRQIDPIYAKKINPHDTYRIQKALEIALLTRQAPSAFFAQNARERLSCEIEIFEIIKPKEALRESIAGRTEAMFARGIIHEVESLHRAYPGSQIFKAIGMKEVLAFLKGEISLECAKSLIIKNTLALAKRQRTFNRTQFSGVTRGEMDELEAILAERYEKLGREAR